MKELESKSGIVDLIIHTEIPFRKKLNLNRKITFGTEIEFENAPKNKVEYELSNKKSLDRWILKNDVSVNTTFGGILYGGEVISPILTDNVDDWKQLKQACDLIKSQMGMIRRNAGSHVHVGINILENNNDYIIKFIKLWTLYEHVIYRFAYGDYDTARPTLLTYASPASPMFFEALNDIKKIKKQLNYEELYQLFFRYSTYTNSADEIRSGIEFSNCNQFEEKRKDTIEFRCPNGTLNEVVWQNNINFFTHLLMYATSPNYNSELMDKKMLEYKERKLHEYDHIYYEDAFELANLIFTDELDKLYFLKQYLKINEKNVDIIKSKVIEKHI